MQKAIASVDSRRGYRVSRASPFASIVLAFCLLFNSPPPAYSQSYDLSSILNLADVFNQIDDLASTYGIDITAMESQYGEYYQQAKDLMALGQQLKDIAQEVARDLNYYQDAAELMLVAQSIDGAVESIESINDAIDQLSSIEDTYESTVDTLTTLNEISDDINSFTDTVSAIKDAVNTVQKINDYANSIISVINFVQSFQNGTFMQNAMKAKSNGIPSKDGVAAIVNPNIDISGLVDDVTTVYCSFGENGVDTICTTGSDAYCNFGHSSEAVCQLGSNEYCNTGLHPGENGCPY